MWVGTVLGLAYALFGFGAQKRPPRLAITIGPFRQGCLFIAGYHIHHWMVYGPIWLLTPTSSLGGFALVMTLHGLSYPDAFVL